MLELIKNYFTFQLLSLPIHFHYKSHHNLDFFFLKMIFCHVTNVVACLVTVRDILSLKGTYYAFFNFTFTLVCNIVVCVCKQSICKYNKVQSIKYNKVQSPSQRN